MNVPVREVGGLKNIPLISIYAFGSGFAVRVSPVKANVTVPLDINDPDKISFPKRGKLPVCAFGNVPESGPA